MSILDDLHVPPLNRLQKLLIFLVAAALLAGVAVRLSGWMQRHDHPKLGPLQIEGDISYNGQPVHVILFCDSCPTYLIVGRQSTLSFRITLQPKAPLKSINPLDAVDTTIEAGSATTEPSTVYIGMAQELADNPQLTQSVPVKINAPDTGLSRIDFGFFTATGPVSPRRSLGTVSWGIAADNPAWIGMAPYVYAVLLAGFLAGLFFWVDRKMEKSRELAELRLKKAQAQADANPEKARFAWDLARVKLEAYFDRNLTQVSFVFYFAVIVMVAGFFFVLVGIWLAYNRPATDGRLISPSMLAAISGIITQFIGATVMVIYRSTMAQANEFMVVLERINTVGMAVQVLDALPNGTDLKDSTRAHMATLLLGGAEVSKAQARAHKAVAPKAKGEAAGA